MSLIFLSLLILGLIASLGAIILYFASQKFKVVEDKRIDLVEEALPGVNCGACGYVGCRGFAEACVNADTMFDLHCPVGGQEVMTNVADILGKEKNVKHPTIAVVKCNGTCEKRKHLNVYDGSPSCAIASQTYGGETACSYGCLGLGDCVRVCTFDAIFINPLTLLPEVDEEKCTSCGACVKACPKLIIEIRKKGPKSRRVYVNCVNKDKPFDDNLACSVACIACGKCKDVCPFDAINIVNNLAYIDDEKCRLCRKCYPVCPTGAIAELNFPPKQDDVNAKNKEAVK